MCSSDRAPIGTCATKPAKASSICPLTMRSAGCSRRLELVIVLEIVLTGVDNGVGLFAVGLLAGGRLILTDPILADGRCSPPLTMSMPGDSLGFQARKFVRVMTLPRHSGKQQG
jgi:hypothetical protein